MVNVNKTNAILWLRVIAAIRRRIESARACQKGVRIVSNTTGDVHDWMLRGCAI